mgnify:CR=1 FL=1
MSVAPPDPRARAAAAERLAGLAVPAGALGRLGDLVHVHTRGGEGQPGVTATVVFA